MKPNQPTNHDSGKQTMHGPGLTTEVAADEFHLLA